MTLHEALEQFEDNAEGHKKYEEAKAYLRDAAMSDPSHEVKANGKTIRLVEKGYTKYDIPDNVKSQYRVPGSRFELEII